MKPIRLIQILLIALTVSSCTRVSVNGDEEAVLLKQPLIFGHGGVDETPITAGSSFVALTTSEIKFKIIPVTYKEPFKDMMTSDNTPINVDAYLKLQIKRGMTPQLYTLFGENWYQNSVMAFFRNLVREQLSEHEMFKLTSNRQILYSIQKNIQVSLEKYITKERIPVIVKDVTLGSITPPQEVLEETRRTASQNQSLLTQQARANSELARKQAEINKAIADKAYQTQMGMSVAEYLSLRKLEIDYEKVELVRSKKNVTVVMGEGLTPTIPIK